MSFAIRRLPLLWTAVVITSISAQDDCSDGRIFTTCGTGCPLTCLNLSSIPNCAAVCVPGCFCPSGQVERVPGGACVNRNDCPVTGGGFIITQRPPPPPPPLPPTTQPVPSLATFIRTIGPPATTSVISTPTTTPPPTTATPPPTTGTPPPTTATPPPTTATPPPTPSMGTTDPATSNILPPTTFPPPDIETTDPQVPTAEPPFLVFPPFPVVQQDAVSPNLTLTCSVSGEGSFHWQWTASDGTSPSEVILLDSNRTSTALFTRVNSDLNGLFRCEATDESLAISSSEQIRVDLPSELEALVESTIEVSLLENVTLACEMYGYFTPNLPEIIWLFEGQELVMDTSYSVTTKEGDRTIQNGGNDVISSVISELIVHVDDSVLLGQYSCQITTQATLNITLSSRENDEQAIDIIIIAAPVAGGVVLIVVIAIGAIITLMCRKRRKQVPITLNGEAVYEAPVCSDPVYEIPIGTKDAEIKVLPSVAYGVTTFTSNPDKLTINEACLMHTREDKNHYSDYDNEQSLYENGQSLYENEQSLNQNIHEQSNDYI